VFGTAGGGGIALFFCFGVGLFDVYGGGPSFSTADWGAVVDAIARVVLSDERIEMVVGLTSCVRDVK
jgi:hypothetical protein